MNNTINFILDKNDKIIVELESSLQDLQCCDDALFVFTKNSQKTIIFHDSLKYGIEILQTMLHKALKNELLLHNSIQQDIGYLYNEEIQEKPGLTYQQLEERKFWVGRNYYLWGYDHLASWMYNNSLGEIILEITSIFPGAFSTKKSELIHYNDWLKNYSPYAIKIISTKIAQEWLNQIEDILKQFNEKINKS